MKDNNGKHPLSAGMTRRQMIGATVGTAAGLCGARMASAEEKPDNKPEEIEGHFNHKYKMPQASVNYYDKGVPGAQICAGCHYFIDPTECLVVEGYVSPYGWCDYYND